MKCKQKRANLNIKWLMQIAVNSNKKSPVGVYFNIAIIDLIFSK